MQQTYMKIDEILSNFRFSGGAKVRKTPKPPATRTAAGASADAARGPRGNWDLGPAQAALHSARDAKEIANDVRQGRSALT